MGFRDTFNMYLVIFLISIPMITLYVAFERDQRKDLFNSRHSRMYLLSSAIVMGLGVVGFYITHMYLSLNTFPQEEKTTLEISVDMLMLGFGIGVATLIILCVFTLISHQESKYYIQRQKQKIHDQYYLPLYQHNPGLVLTFDTEGNFLNTNKIVESYGYELEEILHRPFAPLLVSDQVEKAMENFRKTLSGQATNFETAFISKFGNRIELDVTLIPMIVDKEIIGVYGICKDITSYKNDQMALVEAEFKYRILVEDSLIGIYIIQDGKFVYVNPQLINFSGYTKEELINTEVAVHIFPEDLPLVKENLQKRLMGKLKGNRFQYRVIKKDKSIMHLDVHASKTMYKGMPAVIGSAIDITEQKLAEEKAKYLAYHDVLTGLPNRFNFISNFNKAITNQNVETAAVLYLNLDRFKLINDTLGHDIGDLLLKEVSNKLLDCIGTDDCIARLGGDEFIFLLPNKNAEGALNTSGKILDCLNVGINLKGYELFITPSIGISLYPQDGGNSETLLKNADIAMHQAKQLGNNNIQFYENKSAEITNEVFTMEADLRKAIEHEEFVLYYQPKVDIQSGELSGLEALIRWQHPDKGLISPARFIPLAEETGMIVPIGEWALRQACTQMKALHDKGIMTPVVSVNLSVRQFYQPNLIKMVSHILNETGLPPAFLELEITESMMIDTHHALKIVSELKKLGVTISLDDFGTGYSSLYYLKKFPIDIVKIDQSFVRDCLEDVNDSTIVETIIAMAHQLKLEVIAEGVETKEQLIFLQQHLCNKAQGYLFSKPVPIEEIEKKFAELEQLVDQLGVPQEIREQKWMEEAFRIAQQELHDTIRQQQGMTLKVKEQDGRYIHTLCDGELLYRLGFVPEQILGKDHFEVLSVEVAEEITSYYRRAFNGEEEVVFEMEYNGLHYLASLRPIRKGGQIVEVIASCVDITERKRVEEALKASEEKYRLIAENTSDLIRVVDLNGVLQYVSPSHQSILGYSPEEIHEMSVFQFIHPEDIPYVRRMHDETIATNTPAQIEFRHIHADGHWVYVEAKGTPVRGENGQIESVVIVARDITKRKLAELDFRKFKSIDPIEKSNFG
ncbi:EAL domain-containing protein [Bacillus sp. Marseille-P3661]|uniref:EAL domain-containing protein n=1 Tax=Bacillus sp. Marseille-P3661 TaxID=1936234 RepID=UPI0015E179F7|nr:EAL domain-containing protein [Bacillus sp. Marseille-P3661]